MTKENALSRTLDESFTKFLNEMDKDSKRAAEPAVIVVRKSLPQILDEMEANIIAAAEASRRALEAAKAAGEAAGAATKVSGEAEKRAEEARRAGEKAAESATRAAASAAAKAEETAKSARKSAEEAARKAEEASRTANRAFLDIKAELLQPIKSLEERVKNLEDAIPMEEIVVLREISRDEAEREILKLFSKGKTLYYSDIAKQLGLDLKLVVEVCNELQKRKEIEVIDN